MNKLLILAYNEQLYIKETVLKYINNFEEIIVVNDNSSDDTSKIIIDLEKEYKNIKVISNKKNFGAGKSLEIGISAALESKFNYLIKIDGDNQFENTNVLDMLEKAENSNATFVKADRFWKEGIEGEIPKIRYFGNAFASFLIKFITGNSNINDPLNGLFIFSYEVCENIKIPKLFYRYGYPFFINTHIYKQSLEKEMLLYQYKNKVRYKDETSYISPIILFIKLITYTIRFYFGIIKDKLKYSDYQVSALLDIFSITSLSISLIFLSKAIGVRYFGVDGNQSAWFILFILFVLFFTLLNISSRKILKNINSKIFNYL